MSQFEDNLWESVVDHHGEELAHAAAPQASRHRPRIIVGATGAAAASAATATLLLSATSSAPAFAVTRQPDGSVLVKVTRVDAIAPANRKLASMGVHAYLVAGPAPACPSHQRIEPALAPRAIAVPSTKSTPVGARQRTTVVLIPAQAAVTSAAAAPAGSAHPQARATVSAASAPAVIVATTVFARPSPTQVLRVRATSPKPARPTTAAPAITSAVASSRPVRVLHTRPGAVRIVACVSARH